MKLLFGIVLLGMQVAYADDFSKCMQSKSNTVSNNKQLCHCVVTLAKHRKLGDYSVKNVEEVGNDTISYSIHMMDNGNKDKLDAQCGYSSDAECVFTLRLRNGQQRQFGDIGPFRLVELGGSYYTVYGIAYTKTTTEISNLRVIKISKRESREICRLPH